MKRLLIAGGKFADIPTIESAKKMGYFVITSGNNPNDLGHKYSDEIALEDYSNKEAMLDLAKKLNIDALIPACDDFSTLTCSYINDFLHIGNFDSYENAKIIHHKDLWRKFCAQNNIDSPLALEFHNIQEATHCIYNHIKDKKLIIKPVDSAAGKGISIIDNNTADIPSVVQNTLAFSREKRIVIEEFIEGSKHGFSTILVNKKVVFYFYDNEQYDYNPFAVSGTTTSHCFTDKMIKEIILEIETIANILNLKDGIFHTQTIAKTLPNGEKKLVIIEACRRGGGDLYPKFVSLALNVDYPGIFIQSITGKMIDKNMLEKNPRKFFARQCVMSKKIGVVEKISFKKELEKNIIDKLMWWKNGDLIEDNKRYKAGIIFLEFHSQDEMDEKISHLGDLIEFKLS